MRGFGAFCLEGSVQASSYEQVVIGSTTEDLGFYLRLQGDRMWRETLKADKP